MVEAQIGTGQAACPSCGTPYRPPIWGRLYRCGACERPLEEPRGLPQPTRKRLGVWGAAALVVLAATGLGIGLSRSRSRPRPEPARASMPAPVRLTPELGERLARKAQLLSGDLSRDPAHATLRVALADCYLRLAVLERTSDRAAARRWLDKASECLRPVQDTPSGTRLAVNLAEWERLRWQEIDMPTPGAVAPAVAGITMAAAPTVGGLTAIAPAPGSPGAPPGPHQMRAAPSDALLAPRPAPRVAPPLSSAGNAPGILPPGRLPSGPDLEIALLRLRRDWRASPADVLRAAELGKVLEDRAEQLQRSNVRDHARYLRAARPYLTEAVRVYLSTAERAPLRVQQAGFYAAAGGAYGKMGEWEEEYRLLKKASALAPFSALVWRRLASACLHTGRLGESRLARKRATEWHFPIVVLPQP